MRQPLCAPDNATEANPFAMILVTVVTLFHFVGRAAPMPLVIVVTVVTLFTSVAVDVFFIHSPRPAQNPHNLVLAAPLSYAAGPTTYLLNY